MILWSDRSCVALWPVQPFKHKAWYVLAINNRPLHAHQRAGEFVVILSRGCSGWFSISTLHYLSYEPKNAVDEEVSSNTDSEGGEE